MISPISSQDSISLDTFSYAKHLDGVDSILSIAQMPKGIPVGTLAIGEAGAANAALLAISILGLNDKTINAKYEKWRSGQTKSVPLKP